MTDVTQHAVLDTRHVSINRSNEQFSRLIIESGIVPQNDTLEHVFDTDGSEIPSMAVEMYTHDGGMSTAATATHVQSDGDTIVFEAWDPENTNNLLGDLTTTQRFTEFTHTLAGVSAGAATPAEIATSLNADTTFAAWAYAAVTATNVLTIFPRGPRGIIRFGSGSTALALVGDFTAVSADNAARTFTKSPFIVADWGLTWAAATGTLVVTQLNATSKAKVTAIVAIR